MQEVRIAIVGGGLSGLYAAYLLEQKGIKDYVVLEARDVLGGRIASAIVSENSVAGTGITADNINRYDLGPTWYWPDVQPQLDRLIHDLGLQCFAQFEAGEMLVERSSYEPPMRVRGYVNSPASMRLAGGMGALIDTLRHRLDTTRIITGQRVRWLRDIGPHIELGSIDESGRQMTWRIQHVLLAMPPRLLEATIEFTPPLPQVLMRQWRETATWMAPHAKYIAVYDTPFWREQDLSGEARSAFGALGEIHDASLPGGSAALFGFFRWPAHVRKDMPEDMLRSVCRAQFTRLFGPEAATPMAEFVKDWALDPCTATVADLSGAGHHTNAPVATIPSGPWTGRLTGIASEWSAQFPGYVAGAIDAASLGVHALPEFSIGEDGLSKPRISNDRDTLLNL